MNGLNYHRKYDLSKSINEERCYQQKRAGIEIKCQKILQFCGLRGIISIERFPKTIFALHTFHKVPVCMELRKVVFLSQTVSLFIFLHGLFVGPRVEKRGRECAQVQQQKAL